MLAQGVTVALLGTDFIDEKSMTGCNMGSNRFRTDIPRYLELWQQGRIDLDTLISDRIHLDDVNAAYASLREGTVTRQVVLFD
jgi:S-(hydroxymethyl)glutathione dehydrogenase/alcohol dehydrogenase